MDDKAGACQADINIHTVKYLEHIDSWMYTTCKVGHGYMPLNSMQINIAYGVKCTRIDEYVNTVQHIACLCYSMEETLMII